MDTGTAGRTHAEHPPAAARRGLVGLMGALAGVLAGLEPGFGRPLKAGTPVALRGTAFAGNRGVGGVEVSVDDGATWRPA